MCFTVMTWLMPVTNLCVLENGDHIKWKRLLGYDHHAIVEYVDHKHGRVHVIEYGSDNGGRSFGKGVVRRHKVDDVRGMHKCFYEECDDADTVLQRAKERLGERQYGPLNNCEHFATWCKTKQGQCSQFQPIIATTSVSGLTCGNGGFGTAAGKCIAKCSIEATKNGTTIPEELQLMLTSGSPREVINEIFGSVIADGSKEIEENAVKTVVEVGWLFLASAVVEACLLAYNFYKAQEEYEVAVKHAKDDEMVQKCKEERNKEMKVAACKAVGAIAGSVAVGAAVGSIFPGVGTAAGAVIGNVSGRILGRMFGRWFFE